MAAGMAAGRLKSMRSGVSGRCQRRLLRGQRSQWSELLRESHPTGELNAPRASRSPGQLPGRRPHIRRLSRRPYRRISIFGPRVGGFVSGCGRWLRRYRQPRWRCRHLESGDFKGSLLGLMSVCSFRSLCTHALGIRPVLRRWRYRPTAPRLCLAAAIKPCVYGAPRPARSCMGVSHGLQFPKQAMLQPLRGHSGEVLAVAISADRGKIVSGSGDKSVRVWSAETGQVSIDLH